MKVLVNGGINLSELDGWWAEAYTPEVGWALGDGLEHGDDPALDATEANALYELLERVVIPQFYSRDESGIPTTWVHRMRESMAQLTANFSTNRTVREYTEQHYIRAASAFQVRSARQGEVGQQIFDWQHALHQKWDSLRFGEVRVDTDVEHYLVEAELYVNDLDPSSILVELYADGIGASAPERKPMQLAQTLSEPSPRCIYRATIPAARPIGDYTARVIPQRSGVEVPLECARILWKR
jgi:starch phosphorylase